MHFTFFKKKNPGLHYLPKKAYIATGAYSHTNISVCVCKRAHLFERLLTYSERKSMKLPLVFFFFSFQVFQFLSLTEQH